MTAQPWLRLYRSALNNAKLQRLGLEAVGFWTNLLLMTDDEGSVTTLRNSVTDIAWQMRITEADVERLLRALVTAGLVTKGDDGCISMHDWGVHQKLTDKPNYDAEKQKRYRQNKALRNSVTGALPESYRLDTDTDTDTEKKEVRESATCRAAPKSEPVQPVVSKPKAATRGTRWPADAAVPDEWISEGEAYRRASNLSAIDLRAEALRFANYWSSKAGGGATKIDWKRTWLNWTLTARHTQNGNGNSGQHGKPAGHPLGIFGEALDLERARQREAENDHEGIRDWAAREA